MIISTRIKYYLFGLLIILNILLRFQAEPREIGSDTFEMHIMANSISEFGYAKWILHPLSYVGIYPASYASSLQFLLSGISQSTRIEMDSVIFLYCMILGILSIFSAYIMASELIHNDIFKFLAAFGYSTAPSVLGYTTWTIPSRGLVMILAPILIFCLLKSRISRKYIPLTILSAIFLFASHHLFYFLIPSFFVFFILIIYFRFREYIHLIQIQKKIIPLMITFSFLFMFSIPFFTGHFMESTRYSWILLSYVRYVGIMLLPAMGGLVYLILKDTKSFGEWFLLLCLIFITPFLYEETYMKWFIQIFLIPFAGIGILNIIALSKKIKKSYIIVTMILLISILFSGYYQFLHNYSDSPYSERNLEDSTYQTGIWLRNNAKQSVISNDIGFSARILAISDTTHLLTASTIANLCYGFFDINLSTYKRYSITSEEFWSKKGFEGRDSGSDIWEDINMMRKNPLQFNLSYVVENRRGAGKMIWSHGDGNPSLLLNFAYEKDHIYDAGNIYIWKIDSSGTEK